MEKEYKDSLEYLWNVWNESGIQSIKNGEGTFQLVWPNGVTRAHGNYIGGRQNGKWRYHHQDATPHYEVFLQNGLMHGIYLEFFDNGNKSVEGQYERGIKSGLWTWYYKNGKKEMQGTLVSGKKNGQWSYWFENGNKESTGNYSDDLEDGIWTFWYKAGADWKKGNYVSGKKNGMWITWFENGNKLQEGNFFDDKEQGVWKSWYENGTQLSLGKFAGGVMDSVWRFFYPSGNPSSVVNFVKGKKHGKWISWFDRTDKVQEQGEYWYDLKIGYWTTYNLKGGTIDMEGKYNKVGKQTGKWRYYFPEGGLMQEQNYKDGRLSGKSFSYYQGGAMKSISEYIIIKEKGKGKSTQFQSVPHGDWVFYDMQGRELSRLRYDKGKKK